MTIPKKKLYLAGNYLGFDHESDINNITRSLFYNTPIHFFDYARIHYHGSWSYFTNINKLSHYLFSTEFTFLPKVKIDKKITWHLLSTLPEFEAQLAELRGDFDVDNILSCVVKQSNYIEIYWFGANENKQNAINFYLNNLEILKYYISQFNEKAEDLIELADKNRIAIPEILKNDYRNVFQQTLSLRDNYNVLYLDGIAIEFSKRQYECLNLVAHGYTAKMIANELLLSARTVEYYLDTIKGKLSCNSRSDLIKYSGYTMIFIIKIQTNNSPKI